MHRRHLLTGSLGIVAGLALPNLARAAATPESNAGFSALTLTLTDTSLKLPQPLVSGRYEITIANTGTSMESHSALGRIPDRVTDDEYHDWLEQLAASSGQNGTTDALSFFDIEFVGLPDWPSAGGSVTGVVDLPPGRYFLFDASGIRGYQLLTVDGPFGHPAEPAADLTVTLHEMAIELPDSAVTSALRRWKIENTGTTLHEVAVIPVPDDFDDAALQAVFAMPEDATPDPSAPAFVYQPAAAIGILGPGRTSWLDVQLVPGHYVALCMLPSRDGPPHAMVGMYRFFNIV